MCIIYLREPGITIPFDKFETSVKNNPHGFGLAAALGDGELQVIRELTDKPDAEEIYKLIHEEFDDVKTMIHLRYTTAGATSMRNVHPFPILEKKTDGVDLRMCHNGTIFKFKEQKSELSDTRNFVTKFVRPLFKRLIRGHDIESIMSDEFVSNVLEDIIPSASVLTFMTGDGYEMIINPTGNGGGWDEKDHFYYSNKYSFNSKHREPSTPSHTYYNGYTYGSYKPASPAVQQKVMGNSSKVTQHPSSPINTNASKRKDFALDTKQEYFTEKYNLDLDDLALMSDEFISQLVVDFPEDTELLVKELLCENMKLSARIKEFVTKDNDRKVG